MTIVQDDRSLGLAEASAIGVVSAIETFSAEEIKGGSAEEVNGQSDPVDPGGESIEAIRARLAARGLLHTGPAIVVPKEPRPESPIWVEPAAPDIEPQEIPEDEWDVKPEGSGYAPVRCPQCRGTQSLAIDVTRFRCDACERAWRWAVCESCDALAFTIERQESWRCGCGYANRSWWRTIAAPREALVVVARRRDAAAQAEKARVRAGMRKRRWKIIAGAVAGLLLVAGFVVTVRLSEPTSASGTNVTCRHFDRLRSSLSNGTIGATELDRELDGLKAESTSAEPDVQKAVVDLAVAGRPGKASFLVAQTSLADACDAAQP